MNEAWVMNQSKNDRGSALIIAMIFVTLLTALAASYLDMVSSASMGTYFCDRASQAFYAAEAGVHRLLDQLNNSGASTVSGTLTTGTYSASYSASYDSGTTLVTSTGTVAMVAK